MGQKYKVIVSPPGDTDPPTNPIYTSDDLIGVSPPVRVAPQLISVWQFLSDAQIADVKARTLTLDTSAQIQQAINYVTANAGIMPIGTLFFPAGSYRVETTLTVTGDIHLEGAGQRQNINTIHAPTELIWFGGADSVLIFGANGGTNNTGSGGIARMKLDGRGIAPDVLEIVDCEHCNFRELLIFSGATAGIHLHNTPLQGFPTAANTFDDIEIIERVGSTPNGHCILIDGTSSTASASQGVTNCTFRNILCEYDAGNGVRFDNVGDHCQWYFLQTFTVSGDPGAFGIAFLLSDAVRGYSGGQTFIGPSVGTIYIDKPYAQIDTVIVNLDDANTAFNPLTFGPGANNITFMTNSGQVSGHNKTLGTRETIRHDSFKFIYWDSSNDFLLTEQGAWKTSCDALADGGFPGGSITFATNNTPNNVAAIFNSGSVGSGSGLYTQLNIDIIVTVALQDLTNTVYRFGLMDSISDPPANGIYWEFDPSADATHLRCITRAGGVETAFTSSVVASADIANFFINVQDGRGTFYSLGAPFNYPFFQVTQTTNVPTVALDMVFQVVTKESAAHNMYVYDYKCGYNTER